MSRLKLSTRAKRAAHAPSWLKGYKAAERELRALFREQEAVKRRLIAAASADYARAETYKDALATFIIKSAKGVELMPFATVACAKAGIEAVMRHIAPPGVVVEVLNDGPNIDKPGVITVRISA